MLDGAQVQSQRVELSRAKRELDIPESQFRIVSEQEAKPTLESIEMHFVAEAGFRWWWVAFRPFPIIYAPFADGAGWRHLDYIVPPDSGLVWFVVEDRPEFILCEGTVQAVQAIIGDFSPFEYYLVAKGLEWLVCENHSDVIYAVGQTVVDRLSEVLSRIIPGDDAS